MLGKRLFITTIATGLLFSATAQNVAASYTADSLLTQRALRACDRELGHTLVEKAGYQTSLDAIHIDQKSTSSIYDGVDLHTVQVNVNYSTSKTAKGKAVCLLEWSYYSDTGRYLANSYRTLGVYKNKEITEQTMLVN